MASRTSRRDLFKAGGALAAGAALANVLPTTAAAATPGSAGRKRALRLAHLTDVHVQPELSADAGLIACLHHAQQLPDRPDLILNGGDSIMDSLGADVSRTRAQWKLWQDIWRHECSLPVEHCIGNHDVWGWDKSKSGTTGNEPQYGKKWAQEVFGISERFRSFDRAGWHFIVLDSTHPGRHELYEARLDEPQFEWLVEDLKKTDPQTPVLILSHIPIVSACAYFDGENEKDGRSWTVPGSWMHLDARRLKDLFHRHKNVKLCLSGHIHLQDRVDYNGVTYLCNGAVSGNWWKGNYHECPAGYALVDLYDDGTFDHQYVDYGWVPRG